MECNEAIAVKSANSQNYKLTWQCYFYEFILHTALQMCDITEVPSNSVCDRKMVNTG